MRRARSDQSMRTSDRGSIALPLAWRGDQAMKVETRWKIVAAGVVVALGGWLMVERQQADNLSDTCARLEQQAIEIGVDPETIRPSDC